MASDVFIEKLTIWMPLVGYIGSAIAFFLLIIPQNIRLIRFGVDAVFVGEAFVDILNVSHPVIWMIVIDNKMGRKNTFFLGKAIVNIEMAV
jgi:hypothetical protein